MAAQVPLVPGDVIELWTVRATYKDERSRRWCVCQCVCGTIRAKLEQDLQQRRSRSCGCARAANISSAKTRHGDAPSKKGRAREYRIWSNMLTRCLNPNSPYYSDYGGRGITVCERWKKYENFLTDMGRCPQGKTLERRNNDGNYEPGNCRWATREEQMNNTRRSNFIEARGKRQTLGRWARELGVPRQRLQSRQRLGWSDEEIIEGRQT